MELTWLVLQLELIVELLQNEIFYHKQDRKEVIYSTLSVNQYSAQYLITRLKKILCIRPPDSLSCVLAVHTADMSEADPIR